MSAVGRRGGLTVLGLIAIGIGTLAIIKGELKWNPEKMLKGSQARLVGVGMIVFGIAVAGFGLFFPDPLWNEF